MAHTEEQCVVVVGVFEGFVFRAREKGLQLGQGLARNQGSSSHR